MPSYRLSQEADQDIAGILDYTYRTFGISQAERYFSSLKTCFAFLADNPHAGRARPDIDEVTRSHPHQHHIVLYEVANDDVLILRVLHERMDVPRQFG